MHGLLNLRPQTRGHSSLTGHRPVGYSCFDDATPNAYGAIPGIARGAADSPKANEIGSVAMANRTGPGDVFLDRLWIAGVRDFSRAGDCHFECVGN